jgi:hypothetical protein
MANSLIPHLFIMMSREPTMIFVRVDFFMGLRFSRARSSSDGPFLLNFSEKERNFLGVMVSRFFCQSEYFVWI